ncbi:MULTISPECIES: hypothetical protein [unclassified Ensifer]|uniref:hypothetical protein n=1 Tax=unclassified Ensifer TaxID=2633371 RepID=UPI000813BC1C|nr:MULTISPECIES: hypothetical protein [unclassified Ensifer]OCP09415.1 hypothetical protein BC374_02305 [Ensifer sp. LC13]OCP10591.1 hypothetical protein BBX50_02655 [Ensifer sp. LC11]OCP11650.1 hypothetical protein BC362_07030 [Ensifer sp. LC14]OCP32663.1 hypothetical protein BC364_02305 [Ensifer sp. LC499]
MWEKLQHSLEIRLAQMRAHPEVILLTAFAYTGLLLTMKEAERQLGTFGILLAVAIAAITAYFTARLRGARDIDPPEASDAEPLPFGLLPVRTEDDRRYLVRVPPSKAVAYEVIRKAQGVFQRDTTDPEEDMRAFFFDPYRLICLQDAGGHILGFVDYYAFERNHFKLFLQGDYTFDNLLTGALLAHPQARKAKVVYLATILNLSFLLDSMRVERRRQNGILVWATVSAILEHHTFPADGIDIYSIGWDRSGTAILRMFGLLPVSRVTRGQAEGKWIYSKRGVRRTDLEAIRARYQKRYERWCELDLRPLSAIEPGVANAG